MNTLSSLREADFLLPPWKSQIWKNRKNGLGQMWWKHGWGEEWQGEDGCHLRGDIAEETKEEVQYFEGKAGKGCKDRQQGMGSTLGSCRPYWKGESGNPTDENVTEILIKLTWKPKKI